MSATNRNPGVTRRGVVIGLLLAFAVSVVAFSAASVLGGSTNEKKEPFTDTFNLQACTFATTGQNQFFVLQPKYEEVFDGVEKTDRVHLVIAVLTDTKDVGGVTTRVVRETETTNGVVDEISYNYFAICTETNSVFYFGEDSSVFLPDGTVDHSGSWLATGNNRAGLMMPGITLLGARYYQEVAPGIALDRAEVMDNDVSLVTPAGTFTGCLVTQETTPLEPKSVESKTYAPGIGLVQDEFLLLTSAGYVP